MKSRKLLSLVVASMMFVYSVPAAYGQILHTTRVEETVTQGVQLVSEEILTDIGWRDINILKINLGNENVTIKPIESTTLGERKTVLQMAKDNGAIAGVNADFFDMSATYAPSFGATLQDGNIKHSYNYLFTELGPKKYMATFMLDQGNNIFMDYYGMTISVVSNGTKLFDVMTYNTLTGTLSRPVVVDSQYYKNTASIVSKYPNDGVYTVLVQDGVVTYKSKQGENVTIPEGAQAIILSTNNAAAYYPALEVGTAVNIEQQIALNDQIVQAVDNMTMGIGGGGLIMKNGVAYTGNAHKVDPATRAPRTIIATTNTPEEILLIAIDGRNSTLGANHSELASILSRYGVKDAMYLDGGGSTTLVARNQGSSQVTVQNSPSDLSERRVTNGIGVFSTAKTGTLSKLYMTSNRDRTFIGEGISFEVTGTDEYSNPVTIDTSSVKLSVTGVTGTWSGQTFYPESEGKALVVAEAGGVQVATEIIVTSAPVGLYIEPSHVQMNENSSSKVQVYGVDKYGYKIPLTPEKLQWTSTSKNITANANTISSTQKDIGTLTATYKNASATIGATVGESVVAINSFEEINGKWAGDTTTVQGKVEQSKDIKYHGEQSLKMTYTFDKDANKQVAYTVFANPIEIPADARAINMWVHSKGQTDTMKIQVKDAAGKTHYLKLADTLAYEGWKYQSALIPEQVKLPAKVTKVYVYANGNTEKRQNAIYMDHLSITRGTRVREGIQVRDDYKYDSAYKQTLSAPTGSSYKINVVGQTSTPSLKLGTQDISKLVSRLESNASMLLQASSKNLEMNTTKPTHTYSNAYKEVDYQHTKVMFLGTDAGGLRKTNASQWTQMKQSLESTSAKHIIIVAGKNPLTQFDDVREGKALHTYLKEIKEATDKSIFVVYAGGAEKEVRLEDGIRYIRTNGLSVSSDNIQDAEYLTFKVHEDNIYYTFEPMM